MEREVWLNHRPYWRTERLYACQKCHTGKPLSELVEVHEQQVCVPCIQKYKNKWQKQQSKEDVVQNA